MAYTKQNFEDGQVLTAAHMNHIEDGISDLESKGVDLSEATKAELVNEVRAGLGTTDVVGALPLTGGSMLGALNMNGNTLSGLKTPTGDNEAATKAYVDTAKPNLTGYATETYVNTAVKKASPRNLLDNSDFRNPVNQRGNTSYKGIGYGIDRWEMTVDQWMVGVEKGCIKVSDNPDNSTTKVGMLRQTIAADPGIRGKTVTFAAKIKGNGMVRLNINNTAIGDYTIKDPDGVAYSNDVWHIRTITGTIPEDAETFYVALQSRNMIEYSCEWVALYEGEYTSGNLDKNGNPTVNNLPEYQPKGYGSELAECMRYYQIVKFGYGSVKTSEDATYTILSLSVPMRKGSISVAKYSVQTVRSNGKQFTDITDVQLFDYGAGQTAARVMVYGTFTGAANNLAYIDGLFHLSAEDL